MEYCGVLCSKTCLKVLKTCLKGVLTMLLPSAILYSLLTVVIVRSGGRGDSSQQIKCVTYNRSYNKRGHIHGGFNIPLALMQHRVGWLLFLIWMPVGYITS